MKKKQVNFSPTERRKIFLIMNRLARIYASFDIDGSTFNKLYDYKIFLIHSMESFAGGYYPRTLDAAMNLTKVKWWEKMGYGNCKTKSACYGVIFQAFWRYIYRN